jgi:signal transduction histidine kinase
MGRTAVPLGRRVPRWWRAGVDLVLALVVFVLTVDQGSGGEVEVTGEAPPAMRLLLATATALAVPFRRVNPYPLLVVGAGAWVLMSAPWGLMVAGYTLATQPRRLRWHLVALGVLLVIARLLLASDVDVRFAVVAALLVVGVPVLLGLWVGTRRALVANLRDQAERLEREQLLDAERARAQERSRIARELHDVVAHRVGLMVLHAGALEVSLADPAAARQAALVRETGREALRELRDLLGVLREGSDGVLLDPQPTLADLERLVQQSRDLGMEVSVAVDGPRRQLPATVERAAYRLVQEALTNVHKHAANATTEVGVCYRPGRLEVAVRNARPADGPHPGLDLAGGGHGLVGLRERVTLLGGSFQAGPRLDGGFEVRASIPAEVPA